MHQLFCTSFLILISCELYAASTQSTVELESDIIEEAVVLPGQTETTSPQVGAYVALALGGTGTIFAVLGGIGTGMTCPEVDAFEAAKFLCTMSITGLSLGGICLIAAIGTTVVVIVKHIFIESQSN